MLFIFAHFGFRLVKYVGTFASDLVTYGLVFSAPSISVQSLSLFHIFNIVLGLFGLSMIGLSVWISETRLKNIERKIDLGFFMLFYAFLYSAFWIKALKDKFDGVTSW